MKKLFLLTSVLAIAACGGGGGGGDGGGVAPVVPIRAAVEQDSPVADSNAVVTTMASEILVANGSATAPSIGRSGIARRGDQTYTSYRLDDVTFKMGGEDSYIKFGLDEDGKIISAGKYDKRKAAEGYALSPEGTFVRTADDSSSFGGTKTLYVWSKTFATDDELASRIETALADKDLPEGKAAATFATELANDIKGHFVELEAESDNSGANAITLFNAVIAEEVDDWATSQPYESNAPWLVATAGVAKTYYQNQMIGYTGSSKAYKMTLNVAGADIGLKYADIGSAELIVVNKDDDEDIKEHTFTPYVGGYSVLNVDPADVATETQNVKFTGTAIAGIDHKRKGYNDGKDIEEGVLVRDDTAHLTMNKDGGATLVMNNLYNTAAGHTGEHWYTMQFDKATANAAPSVTIDGNNSIVGKYEYGGNHAYDAPYGSGITTEFTAGDWNASENSYVQHPSNNFRVAGNMETNMYGLSADDEHLEATALFNYSQEYHSHPDNTQHNEVAIYGAFGGGNPTMVAVPEP